jgi:hypothetical protein
MMTGVAFECSQCHAVLKFSSPVQSGKKIKCNKCGSVFSVPAHDSGRGSSSTARKLAGTARNAPSSNRRRPDKPRLRMVPPPDMNGTGFHTNRRLERQAQAIQEVKREADELEAKRRADEAARLRRRERRQDQAERELRRKARLRILLIACGVGIVLAGVTYGLVLRYRQINHGTGNEDLLAYVPGNSALIMGANYTNPNLGEGFSKSILESIEKNLGANTFLSNCADNTDHGVADLFEHIIVAIGPGPVPSLTLIGHSHAPFDQRKLMRSAGNPQPRKYADMVYFEIDALPYTTLFMPSDRTLILTSSSPDEVIRMVGSKGQEIALPEQLTASVQPLRESLFWCVWTPAGGLADVLGQRLSNFEAKPKKAFQKLLDSPQKIRRLTVLVKKGDRPGSLGTLSMQATMIGDSEAEDLETALLDILAADGLGFASGFLYAGSAERAKPDNSLGRLLVQNAEVKKEGATVSAYCPDLTVKEHRKLFDLLRSSYHPSDFMH